MRWTAPTTGIAMFGFCYERTVGRAVIYTCFTPKADQFHDRR